MYFLQHMTPVAIFYLGAVEGMEPDDLLCSRNARSREALARANGTSWRASGWEGEKVARSGRSISPHP